MDNFIGMGFSSDLVVAAIKENGEENANLILETLLKQSACSSASSSNSKVVDHFIGMGFSKEMVLRAIQENGEENTDSILETLLSYMEISTYLSEDEKKVPESDKEKKLLCLVSMGYPVKDAAKALKQCGLDANLEVLTDWLSAAPGARTDDAPIAETDDDAPMAETDDAPVAGTDDSHMARTDDSNLEVSADCLSAATVDETDDALVSGTDDPPVAGTDDAHANLEALTDCLSAAPMTGTDDALMAGTDDALVAGTDDALVARADDAPDIEDEKPIKPQTSSDDRKRKNDDGLLQKKKQTRRRKKPPIRGDDAIRIPLPMIGFGVPTEAPVNLSRKLTKAAIGPPYFYFENVALAPKGVWDTISRFLYDVEPEFVDSKYFCSTFRKRGYVHNLPIENRYPLLPIPPSTIQEALPMTRNWWPKWDPRTKLNCLHTSIASARVTDKILKGIQEFEGDPPLDVQKWVLEDCKRYNLVWVGKNKTAPLEPDELEMLLGFPKNHTRGGGICKTDRYKSLGNSFQVDTVGYHLSVLKSMYPDGINVLSLFSGIGGAEVSLHRLDIKLKTVVSVEISECNRDIVRCWWEQTNQKGTLIHFSDVQELQAKEIEDLIRKFGAFDLVIGGSPCNNLTGMNRFHRNGLEGKDSALFYEFYRILDLLKTLPPTTSFCVPVSQT